MRRKVSLTLAAAIVLLLHRLYDCVFDINPATGFFDASGGPVRFLVLAAAAVSVGQWVSTPPVPGRSLALRANISVSALLGAGAVLVAAGSAYTLLDASALHLPISRVLAFAAGVTGFVAAAWLVLCAFWFVHGRKTDFRVLLSFFVYPAWLCLRAVSVFSRAPVNTNDSVVLGELFCPAVLALCYLFLLKVLVADGRTDKLFYPVVLACFLLCVCFGLPTALVCARAGSASSVVFFLADALCATAAALIAADTRPDLKGDSTHA